MRGRPAFTLLLNLPPSNTGLGPKSLIKWFASRCGPVPRKLALSTQTSGLSGEKRRCRETHAGGQGAVGPVRNGGSGLHV